MKAPAASRFAKGAEAELFQPLAKLLCRLDDRCKIHVWPRIEIEHKAPRQSRLIRRAVPGMKFHRRKLRHGNQALNVVDLHVGFALALNTRLLDIFGHVLRRVSLNPGFVADTIGRANNRAEPPFEMLDHPRSDAFEI